MRHSRHDRPERKCLRVRVGSKGEGYGLAHLAAPQSRERPGRVHLAKARGPLPATDRTTAAYSGHGGPRPRIDPLRIANLLAYVFPSTHLAIPDVSNFLTGDSPDHQTAHFSDDRWTCLYQSAARPLVSVRLSSGRSSVGCLPAELVRRPPE